MQVFYRMEQYWTQVQRAYNKHMVPQSFQVGDLVLRRVYPEDSQGKLGHFHVECHIGVRAYYLQDVQRKLLLRPWNTFHLRPYFSG